jgi:cytoskeleton protein RodZ
MSESEEEQQPVQSISALLSETREKLGLSQKDVADQLFLTGTFIRYIDDGLFEKIPKQAFIKGYLRSYARVIQLSGDEVVAQYEAERESQEQIALRGVTEERVGSSALTGPVLQTGVIGLAAIVLLALLVWAFSGDDEEPLPPPAVTQSIDPQPAIVSLPSVESRQDDVLVTETEAPLVEAAPEAAAVVEGAPAAQRQPVAETQPAAQRQPVAQTQPTAVEQTPKSVVLESGKDVTIERIADDAYQYITVDANGFGQLEFVLTGECWIEIEDGDGDSIYGDLNRENDILTVYGVAPFHILLGRASAVALHFNGDEVDVAKYTTSDQTAKLVLGDES